VSREEPPDSADDGDGYPYLADRSAAHVTTGPVMYELMDNIRGTGASAARRGVAKKKTTTHAVSLRL
jgi:hypothetical protein